MAERRPQIVIPGMVALKSGLIVPSYLFSAGRKPEGPRLHLPPPTIPDRSLLVIGQPPSDLDAVFAAPDPEALGQNNPSLEAICQTLAIVPVEPAMFRLAGIAAAAWHAGRDQAEHLKLAEEIYVGRPVLELLRSFVNQDPPPRGLQRAASDHPHAPAADPRRRRREVVRDLVEL